MTGACRCCSGVRAEGFEQSLSVESGRHHADPGRRAHLPIAAPKPDGRCLDLDEDAKFDLPRRAVRRPGLRATVRHVTVGDQQARRSPPRTLPSRIASGMARSA